MTASPRHARSTVKLVVNDELFKELTEFGRLQCTPAEAAGMLNVPVKEIDRIFTKEPKAKKAFDRGRAEGLKALRRAQLKLAETSAPMAMFLGRNYLDQSDRPEAEQSGAKDVPSAVQRLKVMLANAASAGPPQDEREGD